MRPLQVRRSSFPFLQFFYRWPNGESVSKSAIFWAALDSWDLKPGLLAILPGIQDASSLIVGGGWRIPFSQSERVDFRMYGISTFGQKMLAPAGIRRKSRIVSFHGYILFPLSTMSLSCVNFTRVRTKRIRRLCAYFVALGRVGCRRGALPMFFSIAADREMGFRLWVAIEAQRSARYKQL